MNFAAIYGLLFALSVLYALALETETGRWHCEHRTWLTVATGVCLVLAVIWPLLTLESWLSVAAAFVVAGTPMIIRSQYHDWRKHRD